MKILIVGAGQVGRFLCERFPLEGHEVTLVDRNEEGIRYAQDHFNVLGVTGNGASAEVLELAGIADTDLFIAVTDSDEANILSCLIAREYQVATRISRVKNIDYSTKGAVLSKEKLGIDLMINPRDAVADEIVRIASHSGTFAGASVIACLANVGPGLGSVGPADNFAHVPTLGKAVLIFCMLLGRLELFTVLVLFFPSFWRK